MSDRDLPQHLRSTLFEKVYIKVLTGISRIPSGQLLDSEGLVSTSLLFTFKGRQDSFALLPQTTTSSHEACELER